MTKSRTKQSVDILQQMVTDIFNKAQVEKDAGQEANELLRILIVTCHCNSFFFFHFCYCLMLEV